MKLSYCTTCKDRVWQLEQTLPHNTHYLQSDVVDLIIIAFNDTTVKPFLQKHYADYLNDGRIKLIEHFENIIFADGSDWSCGYVKDIAHRNAIGDVLFNLDADNFIDDELHELLLNLKPNEIVITKQTEWLPDGRSGRIGIHKSIYGKIRYQDKGRSDDGDFIIQAILSKLKIKQIACKYKPVSNNRNIKKHPVMTMP